MSAYELDGSLALVLSRRPKIKLLAFVLWIPFNLFGRIYHLDDGFHLHFWIL